MSRYRVRIVGRGERTMLFAHGFATDQRIWRLLSPQFESEYRVVLFDYLGAGKSDLDAYGLRRYESLDGYASDVLELCEALELRDAILVAHSVSGMVGVLAANREPSRFSDLILIGPSPRYLNDAGYTGGFERAEVDQMLQTMEQDYAGWALFLAPRVTRNADRPWLAFEVEQSFRDTNPGIARHLAQVVFYSDHRVDLAKVTVPSLILQCADDLIVPESVGEYLRDNLPHSTLRFLSAHGHYPQLTDPDETATAMRAYLAARAP